jgi:hypothetical protein
MYVEAGKGGWVAAGGSYRPRTVDTRSPVVDQGARRQLGTLDDHLATTTTVAGAIEVEHGDVGVEGVVAGDVDAALDQGTARLDRLVAQLGAVLEVDRWWLIGWWLLASAQAGVAAGGGEGRRSARRWIERKGDASEGDVMCSSRAGRVPGIPGLGVHSR